MPRPRSDEKRAAILEAATRIIVREGLSAPTAGIAKEARVANGSLFTYFQTKTDLFNALYLDIKADIASSVLKHLPATGELHEELHHAWRNWMDWGLSNPEKRRALAQLAVSDEITAETRHAGHRTMSPVAELLERGRAGGPLQKTPLGFVVALMNSVAEATMDFMTQNPANAQSHGKAGFDAFWRMLN
jgi:AcrR family transcriptional regulator